MKITITVELEQAGVDVAKSHRVAASAFASLISLTISDALKDALAGALAGAREIPRGYGVVRHQVDEG